MSTFIFALIFLCSVIIITELVCPYTKVEESFNMQAMHDFLLASDTTHFDHQQFPGVVPRTFLASWLVSLVTLWPLAFVAEPVVRWSKPGFKMSSVEIWMKTHPLLLSHACRIVLSAAVIASLWDVAIALERSAASLVAYTKEDERNRQNRSSGAGSGSKAKQRRVQQPDAKRSGSIFLLLCATQFHIIFYASRPLPNTFGLICCNVALSSSLSGRPGVAAATLTTAAALFRCDVLALLLPYGILAVWRGLGLLKGVAICLITATVVVSITALGLDSLLWGRWVWPEASVLFFNTVQNRSAEWGVQPLLWYWTKALPRALLWLYPFVCLIGFIALRGLLQPPGPDASFLQCVGRKYENVILPALCFIMLYSALPHKEMRFIMIVFPWLLAPVAVVLAALMHQIRTTRTRRLIRRVLILTGFCVLLLSMAVSIAVSESNYPGGEALKKIHEQLRMDMDDADSCVRRNQHTADGIPLQPTVFIDAYAAMSGISRFQKIYAIGHAPLLQPQASEVVSWVSGHTMGVELRWWRLLLLPFEALSWRTWRCLPDFGQTIVRIIQDAPWEWVRSFAVYIEARHRTIFAAESIDGSSSLCKVRMTRRVSPKPLPVHAFVLYLKDPARFLTAAEHSEYLVAQSGSGPTADKRESRAVRAEDVYNATDIDYAIVRASQREMHLVDHDVFQLIASVSDGSERLPWMLSSAMDMTCKAFKALGGETACAWLPSMPMPSSTEYLLLLRRKSCRIDDTTATA